MIARLIFSLLTLFSALNLADAEQAKGPTAAAKIEELRVQLFY